MCNNEKSSNFVYLSDHQSTHFICEFYYKIDFRMEMCYGRCFRASVTKRHSRKCSFVWLSKYSVEYSNIRQITLLVFRHTNNDV